MGIFHHKHRNLCYNRTDILLHILLHLLLDYSQSIIEQPLLPSIKKQHGAQFLFSYLIHSPFHAAVTHHAAHITTGHKHLPGRFDQRPLRRLSFPVAGHKPSIFNISTADKSYFIFVPPVIYRMSGSHILRQKYFRHFTRFPDQFLSAYLKLAHTFLYGQKG